MATASLQQSGWEILPSQLDDCLLDRLGETAFQEGVAGTRCLLDAPLVADAAQRILLRLIVTGHLSENAVAIQAIAFDKTPAANWKVSWHQDVMFPFSQPMKGAGFELSSVKDGIDYARPPRHVLESLLAARLHIDDCHSGNGPLRVSPGTHLQGILRGGEVQELVARHGQVECVARRGELLLMKPLLLHASSQAQSPSRRRVLHFVFHEMPGNAVPWYRAVGKV